MSHRAIPLHAIAHGAEACLALLHLFDHGRKSDHAHHYEACDAQPQTYRGNQWVVEACACGAVRRTLLAYDAGSHCVVRTYQGVDP